MLLSAVFIHWPYWWSAKAAGIRDTVQTDRLPKAPTPALLLLTACICVSILTLAFFYRRDLLQKNKQNLLDLTKEACN